jgi:4-amino-4-deoxy-L-arabinose transferase-like glycosyltransferase
MFWDLNRYFIIIRKDILIKTMILKSAIFKDIRFWIILFFLIRLIGITNPPLEVAHNWRQTTVTMVSRNFLETNNNILYPRIDIAGNKTGITGMEFPFLNYIIYIFSLIFGYQHWYGRLINLIISSVGTFFFYKLIKKYFEEKIAFHSTLIFLSSIWFAYSRKIMPDTFSMSFILASIYYGTNYLDNDFQNNKIYNLLAYSMFVMFGVLSKLPSAYLLVLFIMPLLNKGIHLNRKIIFIIASIVCLVPPYLWYFYWVPHLVKTFGFWHFFMGIGINQGIHEIFGNIHQTSEIL